MTQVGTLLPGPLAAILPRTIADHRANWVEVARKEVADLARSSLSYTLCGLFVAVLLAAATVNLLDPPTVEGQEVALDLGVGLGPVVWVVRWLVPLTGLLVGYGAVAGEREAGSLRVLLGLPITRRDVVVGKLLGRSVTFGTMLLVGVAVAGAVLWRFYADFSPGAYATFAGLALVLGVTFVAMGVGLSAAFRSRSRALGTSTVVFALLVVLWPAVWSGVVLFGGPPADGSAAKSLLVFFGNVNPTAGFEGLVEEWVAPFGATGPHTGTTGVESGWLSLIQSPFADDGAVVVDAAPFYLQPPFLLAVMLLWGFVPLLVGTRRFVRTDLR